MQGAFIFLVWVWIFIETDRILNGKLLLKHFGVWIIRHVLFLVNHEEILLIVSDYFIRIRTVIITIDQFIVKSVPLLRKLSAILSWPTRELILFIIKLDHSTICVADQKVFVCWMQTHTSHQTFITRQSTNWLDYKIDIYYYSSV